MKEKNKAIEKVSFGITVMFFIYWLYVIFIQKQISLPSLHNTIIGLFILYGIGLFILFKIFKPIPNSIIEKNSLSPKSFMQCFLLQFTALMLMGIVTLILSKVSGQEVAMELDNLSPARLFILIILAPIVEEFVFRKLLADKLLKYGEGLFIFISSFSFALVHLVPLGLPQVVYTFFLGMIWSYVYAKTGNLKIPIILHSLSNIFGGIIMQLLQQYAPHLVSVYSLILMLLGILGLVLFFLSKNKIKIDGESRLWNKSVITESLSNRVIKLFVVVSVAMALIKFMSNR